MMQIINLTPHILTVLVEDENGTDEVIVGRGSGARTTRVRVAASVPSSGTVAGAREESVDSSPITVDGVEVPVQARRFGAPTNLPEPAGRDVSDLLTPGLLATKDGKPYGILSFARQG